MTPRVREILSWYGADNPGVLAQLARVFSHGQLSGTGRAFIFQCGEKYGSPNCGGINKNPNSVDPLYHFEVAIEAGCSALMAPAGILEMGARDFAGEIPLILSNRWPKDLSVLDLESQKALLEGAVAKALSLGCSALSSSLTSGSVDQFLPLLCSLVEKTKAAGLPVFVEITFSLENNPSGLTLDAAGPAIQKVLEAGVHGLFLSRPSEKLSAPEVEREYRERKVNMTDLKERTKYVIETAFNAKRICIFTHGEETEKTSLQQEVSDVARGGSFGSMVSSYSLSKKESVELIGQLMNSYNS